MTVGCLPPSKKMGKSRKGGEIEAATRYKPHQSDLQPHAQVTT